MNAKTIANIEYYQGKNSAPVSSTPVAVDTSSTILAAANTRRRTIVLQNNGTEPVIVKLGSTAAAGSYNYVLKKATAARDGLGGEIEIRNYTGIITGICEANSSVVSVVEL